MQRYSKAHDDAVLSDLPKYVPNGDQKEAAERAVNGLSLLGLLRWIHDCDEGVAIGRLYDGMVKAAANLCAKKDWYRVERDIDGLVRSIESGDAATNGTANMDAQCVEVMRDMLAKAKADAEQERERKVLENKRARYERDLALYRQNRARCSRCGGDGLYKWGAVVNGVPQYQGVCFADWGGCGGKGSKPVTKPTAKKHIARLEQAIAEIDAKLGG